MMMPFPVLSLLYTPLEISRILIPIFIFLRRIAIFMERDPLRFVQRLMARIWPPARRAYGSERGPVQT